MTEDNRPAGMKVFITIWAGQLVSLLGTAMTGFAMTIWAWKFTGRVTPLALVGVFNFGSLMLVSPIAGALVDRWNRRLIMILSDLTAGLSTVLILSLYVTGYLQIWHLYVTGAVAGTSQAFHLTAYSSSVSLIVPKKQYVRASGMMAMAEPASRVFAPIIAGALLAPIGFAGILIIDIASFVVAIGTLLFMHIPQPKTSEAGLAGQGNLWQESWYGIRYIHTTPSLLGIIMIFFVINLLNSFVVVMQSPMILARTGDNTAIMATVLSVEAIGGFIGGLLFSIWGGPKRKIHGMLVGLSIGSLFGMVLMGLGRIPAVWFLAAFFFGCHVPIVSSSIRAILMAKVPPDVQGRVFGSARLIGAITLPLSMLLVAPLADRIFEPAMMPGGVLADVFGGLVGSGPGSGMAFLYVIFGILCMLVSLFGYAFRVVRDAEDILPDHDTVTSFEKPVVTKGTNGRRNVTITD